MKFYDLTCADSDPRATESKTGKWVIRDDAEQAAKDAVKMARWVQTLTIDTYAANTVDTYKSDRKWKQAQAIIDKYKEIT